MFQTCVMYIVGRYFNSNYHKTNLSSNPTVTIVNQIRNKSRVSMNCQNKRVSLQAVMIFRTLRFMRATLNENCRLVHRNCYAILSLLYSSDMASNRIGI